MYKILIAEFKHETNTFSDQPTGLDAFKKRGYVLGDKIVSHFRGTGTEIGGFLHVLEEASDVELIPVVAATAMPSGKVTDAMFAATLEQVEEAIRGTARLDGVLLSLHGAMVTEGSDDGEGDFLAAVRAQVGSDVPIMATLDLHSNITEKMVGNADALFHYDFYPHVDMYERGMEAARAMLSTLRGKIRPVMKCSKKPLLLPSMATAGPEMERYVAAMHDYEKIPGVISVSISHGFFCADIHDLGIAVIAITDDDPSLARRVADELAGSMWEGRAGLMRKLYTPDQAIDEANRSRGTVVFADSTDNPGGGSTCDGTHLLRAMIARKVENAALAMIYDPQAVETAEKAGVGKKVKLSLGGKLRPDLLGEPIECMAYVKMISDGVYVNKGPMGRGLTVDLMKSALLVIGGIEVIVSSNVTQPYDSQIFRAHGIEPRDKHILVVKSTVHFRADFEPLAEKIIDVECPGLLPQDVTKLAYKRCRRPIYPLDDI